MELQEARQQSLYSRYHGNGGPGIQGAAVFSFLFTRSSESEQVSKLGVILDDEWVPPNRSNTIKQTDEDGNWLVSRDGICSLVYLFSWSNDMYHSHQKDMSVSGHRDLLVISEIQKSKLGMITAQCLFIEDC